MSLTAICLNWTVQQTELEIPVEPVLEPVASAAQSQPDSDGDSAPSVPDFGPMPFQQYIEDMKTRVKSGIEGLTLPDEDIQKYLEFFKADRVVVEVDRVCELFEGPCPEIGCSGMRKVVDKMVEAGVLLITHKCSQGHGGVWVKNVGKKCMCHLCCWLHQFLYPYNAVVTIHKAKMMCTILRYFATYRITHEQVTTPEEPVCPQTRSQNYGDSRIILAEVGSLP